jgi:hypothetical protein
MIAAGAQGGIRCQSVFSRPSQERDRVLNTLLILNAPADFLPAIIASGLPTILT